MPQRNRDKTVYGGQGDDAFVKLKKPSGDEIMEFQRISADETLNVQERESAARKYLAKYIVDWNWVDDNEAPLPKPCDDPDVFGKLLSDEFRFIYEAWTGRDAAEQSRKKK